MIERIKKAGRTFRRDYWSAPSKIDAYETAGSAFLQMCPVGGGFGAFIGFLCGPYAGIGLMIGLGLALADTAWTMVSLARKMQREPGGMCFEIIKDGKFSPVQMSGPPRDIAILHNTQRLIVHFNKKCHEAEFLPPRVCQKLPLYIADAQEAARHVSASTPDGAKLAELEFDRWAFNKGKYRIKKVVAIISTADGLEQVRKIAAATARADDLHQIQNGLKSPLKVKRPAHVIKKGAR